jgi:hypothetical protein
MTVNHLEWTNLIRTIIMKYFLVAVLYGVTAGDLSCV